MRIAPDEVHLSDPNHYDVVYGPESAFSGDLGFELALKPFFSRRSVLDIESLVQSKVDKLCRRVSADRTVAQPSNLHAAFRAVSVDVITEYAFDECWHQLEADDLGERLGSVMRGSAPVVFTLRAFPSWGGLIRRMPDGIARRISPAVADFLRYQGVRQCRRTRGGSWLIASRERETTPDSSRTTPTISQNPPAVRYFINYSTQTPTKTAPCPP